MSRTLIHLTIRVPIVIIASIRVSGKLSNRRKEIVCIVPCKVTAQLPRLRARIVQSYRRITLTCPFGPIFSQTK